MGNNDKKESIFKNEYIRVFTKISGWIIGPVLVSALVGNYLDKKFNSAPWILGFALAVSFTVSMVAIVKIAKKYDTDLLAQTGVLKDLPEVATTLQAGKDEINGK
jgi:F0F1-type ATP synthase assembly protein I